MKLTVKISLAMIITASGLFAVLGGIKFMEYRKQQEFIRRFPSSRVVRDLRSLATCIESYYIDHQAYPVSVIGGESVNNIPGAMQELLSVPTFRNKQGPDDPLHTLTTPISYCTSYFADPWARTKRATFGYYPADGVKADGQVIQGWILWSAGPDEDYDIGPETDYDPVNHPTPSLIGKTFDPTNGATSDGDIWRARIEPPAPSAELTQATNAASVTAINDVSQHSVQTASTSPILIPIFDVTNSPSSEVWITKR